MEQNDSSRRGRRERERKGEHVSRGGNNITLTLTLTLTLTPNSVLVLNLGVGLPPHITIQYVATCAQMPTCLSARCLHGISTDMASKLCVLFLVISHLHRYLARSPQQHVREILLGSHAAEQDDGGGGGQVGGGSGVRKARNVGALVRGRRRAKGQRRDV